MASLSNSEIIFNSIPRSASHKLDKKVDSEHGGVQVDLGRIGDSMDEWEGKIAEQLQLTKSEIEAIKTKHPRELPLQTRAALQKWQEKFGPMATYRNLITAFVKAGKGDYAEAVCKVISESESESDSESILSPPPSKCQRTSSVLDPQNMTSIQRFAMYLKGVYKRANTSSDKFPHISCSKFINLALVKKERVNRSEADEFTKATLHGHIDEILKKKEPIKLEEVLNPTEGQPDMNCIFLEGAPGVGKSTCVGELCRKWDEINSLKKKYSLIILVRLREKQVQEAKSIENLCFHESTDLRMKVAAEIEACEGRGVLFILDGFDELPASIRRESIFVKLIKGTYLSHCKVLVTSRPSATADFQKVAQCQIHKQVEVVGFTQEQIEEYAKAAFVSQRDVLADFLTYINTYPAVRSMMYIPLNSAIVVDIYRYNRTANRPIPKTMTQLYVELSLTLLARHLGENDPLANQLPQSLGDLPLQLYRPFYELAKLAFEGLERNEVVFYEVPDSLEHFGFMNSPTDLYMGRKVSMSCSFLHLTLQEFLTAFHISQFAPNVQKSVFEKYCEENAGWDVVWRFVAGLTGFKGIGWEMVKARRGRFNVGDISPFCISCLYESQEKVDSVLSEKKLKCDLSGCTALECYAVGYCVANSKCMWKLKMEESPLSGTLVEMLTYGLKQCSSKCPSQLANILELCLIDCDLVTFDQLADVIPLMTNLRELDIQRNPVDEGGLEKLLFALSQLKNVQKLNMIDIAIGCTDVEALSHLISPSSSIKELAIGDVTIQVERMELLLKTVLSPSSLESVEFSCGGSWTAPAKKLLQENKNLKKIECHCFPKFKDEYLTTETLIFEALHKNSHLNNLRLEFDGYPCDTDDIDDTVCLLSPMFEINNSLEHLTIDSCRKPVQPSILENGKELQTLIKALTKLNNAVQHNYTLKNVNIYFPHVLQFPVQNLDPRIVFHHTSMIGYT